MHRIASLTVLCLFVFITQTSVHAKKLALVIGNDNYPNLSRNVQLERARNDARAVGQTLKRLGFVVLEGYDLNRAEMNLKISDLEEKIEPGDEVVFFFAGHGIGIKGRNYLIPTDVPDTDREGFLKSQSILVSRISNRIKESGARISILILDACRDNPFQRDEKGRTIGNSRGLSGIDNPAEGTLVLFSAGANQEALDRLSNVPDISKNSVFTRTLIPLMEQKGLEIKSLANLVRKRVRKLARKDGHRQTPASYDEIVNDYYLAGRSIKVESIKRQKNKDTKVAPKCSAQDTALWMRVDAKKDKASYRYYLQLFPNGCYAAVARYELRQRQTDRKKTKKKSYVELRTIPVITPFTKKAREDYLTHGAKFQDCPLCPKMIVVQGDIYVMGSRVTEKGRDNDEGPLHKVRIKKLAVGQFEITRKQFHAFVRETGYDAGNKCYTYENSKWGIRSNRNYLNPGFNQGDDHPVTCVSWDDAKAYVRWLSRKTARTYRLLTESEWEYVAGAKKNTAFWWGNSISTNQANYDGNYIYNGRKGFYRRRTVAVTRFSKNPFGLYNVHGNVWEWVEDCYHKSYRGAPNNGSAWLNENGGNCKMRVLRGGSWMYLPQDLRTRYRARIDRENRYFDVGFRVASVTRKKDQIVLDHEDPVVLGDYLN